MQRMAKLFNFAQEWLRIRQLRATPRERPSEAAFQYCRPLCDRARPRLTATCASGTIAITVPPRQVRPHSRQSPVPIDRNKQRIDRQSSIERYCSDSGL